MKSPKKFMSACLFSLTDGNFFQSGIFLPSMTWDTFVWAVTLTFGDLATDYCRQLTSCFTKAHTVGDVCHRYDENNSIKSAERERRTKVTAQTKVSQVIEGRNIQNVVNRDIIFAISQDQSTSENNFWIDITGYDFTRFAFQGCFGIHVFKCF
jgi:hypothetical protein